MLPLHTNKKSGRQYVTLKGAPGSKPVRISTGTKSRAAARKMIKAANLEEVQMAAQANLLTAEAITRLKAGKRVTVAGALKDYLETLPLRGYRASTINHETAVLNRWSEDMKLAALPIGAVEDKHIDKFINGRHDGKYTTRIRQLSAIRVFLRFCLDRGWIAVNPAATMAVATDSMPQAMLLEEETKPFTDDEVKKILASDDARGFWHAATLIGWHTGLRLSDVATLQWDSLRGDRIQVFTSKGRSLVDMELSPELKSLFAIWPRGDSRYVFQGQAAEALAGSSNLSQQFRRLCIGLGIEGKSFSSLRHGFAMKSMVDASEKKLKMVQELIGAASLDEVRKLLGHAKSKVTLRYLSHPGSGPVTT
jgi:integrase